MRLSSGFSHPKGSDSTHHHRPSKWPKFLRIRSCLPAYHALLHSSHQRIRGSTTDPTTTVFNQKVLERRTETAVMSSAQGSSCEVCNKVYTTENAYRSHIQSKKHKENETKAALKAQPAPAAEVVEEKETPVIAAAAPAVQPAPALAPSTSLIVDENATEEEITKTIEEKIAAARARLSPPSCLFCSEQYPTLDENLTHMSTAHSFFIPDAEYLIDLPGLISYLGEKIAVGNVCIFCNERGREFRSLDAVRKHMIDKSHCKISFETESDRLEISDFYDFTSSYPDAGSVELKKKKATQASSDEEEEEWEDAEDVDDGEVDEIVDESESDETSSGEDDLPEGQITYGDTNYELVLPSGARIGHRTMRKYYAQSFPGAPRGSKPEDPNSGAALAGLEPTAVGQTWSRPEIEAKLERLDAMFGNSEIKKEERLSKPKWALFTTVKSTSEIL
ncbi:unnamed protein product [Cyclocybe aegerita]|uniref:C2H2-type domain-containing protein n=1 Tax=Cyclocybe aegerita TaxID=1973307 RepID=A0A8S0WV05_CYCAE|nr:unnamed protein product [Cyclocybe aegerita]